MINRFWKVAVVLLFVASCGREPTGVGEHAAGYSLYSNAGAPTMLPGCSACLFGPQVYTRSNGKPVTETALIVGYPGEYLIDIDDGGSQGADGSVALNETVLLAPREEGETGPRHVNQMVVLGDENTLEVRLTGKPGSWLKIEVLWLPGASWWNQTLTFDDAQVPDPWQTTVFKGGPGLVNDRLQADQIDGDAEVGASGPFPPGTTTLKVSYDANMEQTCCGMYQITQVTTTTGTYRVGFTTSISGGIPFRLDYAKNSSGSILGLGGPLGPLLWFYTDDGILSSFDQYRVLHQFQDGSVETVVARLSDGVEMVRRTNQLPGFLLQDVTGLYQEVHTTTGPSAWLDNLTTSILTGSEGAGG